MNALRHITRFLLLHALAVSLSVAGIVPQILASGEASPPARLAEPESREKSECCCGTREARCCATLCCSGAAPVQPTSPAPSKTDDGRGQTITLAPGSAAAPGTSAANVALFAAAIARTGKLTPLSLQTLHVRLDA